MADATMQHPTATAHQWLRSGGEALTVMLDVLAQARTSVRLEMYTFSGGPLGQRFLETLVRLRQQGVQVKVMIDAIGSLGLPDSFWEPLVSAGGEYRVFNPLALNRFGIRDHRKLLVCDGRVAIIGGFNIAPEYNGDGIEQGWFDCGMKLEGPMAGQLAAAFDDMFARAKFQHKRFVRLRRSAFKKTFSWATEQILFSGPGRGPSPIKQSLRADLVRARDVKIIVAYFLPTRRLRLDLMRAARRGTKVQLLLAGKSDVLLSQLAGQSLYAQLLRSGVEIYEYQPQILHAKLVIVDDAVYTGSSNLDQRSLQINYELMVRFNNAGIAREAREIFASRLRHCLRITAESWRESTTFWSRLKQTWAYFLLVRIDPYIARKQWRALKD